MEEQKTVIFLTDGKVSLRPSVKGDAQLFLRWFNDPAIKRFISGTSPVYETEEERFIADRPSRQPGEIHLVIAV